MTNDAPPNAGAPATPAEAPSTTAAVATAPERRRLDSRQLFGSGHEVEIAHAGSIYRLRRTALDKLILTK